MNFTLMQIDHKTTGSGKPYLRVQAKPGGWGSIWATEDIALVKENGSGPYEGESESETKGDKTFVNFKNLTLAPTPAPEAGTMPPSMDNGGSSIFRKPMHIIRTDALRLAQEAIITRSATEGGFEALTVVPGGFEGAVLAMAQRYARYIEDGMVPDLVQRIKEPEAPGSQQDAPEAAGGGPPTGPSPVGDAGHTLVVVWKALTNLVGEGKANLSYQQYLAQHPNLAQQPPDDAQQLEITQILLKAAQAAASRKARLDKAESGAG